MAKWPVLIVVVLAIVAAIVWLEQGKVQPPQRPSEGPSRNAESESARYQGPEVAGIAAELNTDGNTTIAKYVGKQVILVDFWTYSCINCLRTLPYLRAWWDRYREQGLVILGVHTPEFEFEKEVNNVRRATEKFNVTWPVLLDNDYVTWRNFENHYWPHKYLIDIHGKIVYDHIGEGGYAQTEKKIQEALEERARVLAMAPPPMPDTVEDPGRSTSPGQSPEIYFGTQFRRGNFANMEGFPQGQTVTYALPQVHGDRHQVYLDGAWLNEADFMEAKSDGALVLLNYVGRSVNLVAGADLPVNVAVSVDGKVVQPGYFQGADVGDNGSATVQAHTLYNVVESPDAGAHELQLRVKKGFRVYTFTFG